MKPECNSESIRISWGSHLELPSRNMDGTKSPGLAGVFSGYSSEFYIVAGGANFADKPLAEGGRKQWWGDLYVHNGKEWKVYKDFLPAPVGYGYSQEIPEGLLCIGGCNGEKCSDQAYIISIDKDGNPVIQNLASMPYPLANMAGGMIDRKVYLAGGIHSTDNPEATMTFLCLDLDSREWKELDSWNGEPRAFATSAVQNDRGHECLYIFSGRNFKGSKVLEILYDGWRYDPQEQTWQKLEGYFPVMAGTAMPVGTDKILFFGGRCETGADDNVTRLYDIDKGTITENTVTGVTIPVTTVTNFKGAEFTIASGETAPGLRTPLLTRGHIEYIN